MAKHLFTSESVTEGHPDKVCDQISDAVLDEILSQDKNAHVACEVTATTGMIHVMGEISTDCYVDIADVARKVVNNIVIMSAHRLTDGKLDETDKERNNEQQGKNPSRNLGMEDIANRLSHQDSKVEAPHIEAQILHALHLIHPFRQKLAAQQSQKQRTSLHS